MAAPGSDRICLLGLSGSLRADSYNTAVLRTLADRLGGVTGLCLFPLNEIPLYKADYDGDRSPTSVRDLRGAVHEADGLVLCSPEYNYGMSGVLKNAIDWISRPALRSALKNKPTLLMSCSPAYTGGARAHAQMRETLCAWLARVIARTQVVINYAGEKIIGGRLADSATLAFIDEALEDLIAEILVLRRLAAS
jgi:chromate reductase, NAD(P)H dehydrogenase (quinone)